MEYNQISKLLLKNLLKYGGTAIRKRSLQKNDSQEPDKNYQIRLVKVFSDLLGEDYDVISFERNILKKRFLSIPNAKMIIKLLYRFIYVIEIDGSRIGEFQINELSKNIKNVVTKLNRLSRFFGIKRPLCVKIDELTKIKKQCFVEQTDDIVSATLAVHELAVHINNVKISDMQKLVKQLDSINEYILVAKKNGENSNEFVKELQSFFSKLNSKFKGFDEYIKSTSYKADEKDRTNKITEEILSNLKISKIYLKTDFEIPKELEDFIKTCEDIHSLTESTEQALIDLEEKKQSTAYSFKSFERVLTLHERAISKANELLKEKGFKSTVSYKPIEEYQNMLKNKDIRILKKEFYDKAVKRIKEGVYKAIAKPKKDESIFGDKKPDSDKVLNELFRVLKDVPSHFGDKQKQLKNVFKSKHIDLSAVSSEDIVSCMAAVLGLDVINKNLKKIEMVLNHRDISLKLNYKNLFIETLNEDTSVWKKIEKSVYIKGKTPVDATISSTPASELGYFTHLQKGHGLSSQQRESEHVVNLWETQVKTSKDGKVLFSGIRHGNTRGVETATKEIVLAAAVQQYGFERLQNSAPGKVWDVKLGNIQIMSPVGKMNPISPDKQMSLDQISEFKKIYEQCKYKPLTVEMRGKDGKSKEITLRLLKPILVNFGSNIQHFLLGGRLVKSSYEQNREAFVDLFGDDIIKNIEDKSQKVSGLLGTYKNCFASESSVGKYLNDLEDEIRKPENKEHIRELVLKRRKIINLSSQLLFIWQKTKGKGDKSNPYAIQARLAALLYLIGYPVSFNCKSGKDRTGVLASEINDLVITMESNEGNLPEPYGELSDEEKLKAKKVYDATRPYEITGANTGYKGLKVNGAIEKRLGRLKGASANSSIDRLE